MKKFNKVLFVGIIVLSFVFVPVLTQSVVGIGTKTAFAVGDGPGGPDSGWCNALLDAFYDPSGGSLFGFTPEAYQAYILRLMAASSCAL